MNYSSRPEPIRKYLVRGSSCTPSEETGLLPHSGEQQLYVLRSNVSLTDCSIMICSEELHR
eukprot:scaffold2269_cov149-Skeletonema_menzelii.AAC.10